jgi:hypothetical protein
MTIRPTGGKIANRPVEELLAAAILHDGKAATPEGVARGGQLPMSAKTVRLILLSALVMTVLCPVQASAQGDKVLTQVADGTGADGTQFITKLNVTNLGPTQSTEITRLKVMFFRQDGSPWPVATNLGTASEFPLDLGAYQNIRIRTSGTAPALTSGYAVIRNTESATVYAEDYQVAITAYYEVRKGGALIDTISVPVSEPTLSFVIPVEIDAEGNLFTAFAAVNLASGANNLRMQLFRESVPPADPASDGGSATVTLNPAEQRALFLYPGIFPSAASFSGMLKASTDGPVAILALLQSPTPTGVQYATIVPAYLDALRRNTYAYLRLGYSLDADRCISDYWWDQNQIHGPDFEPDVTLPWDLLFEEQSSTARRLTPQGGAQFAVIGQRTSGQFDQDVTLPYLQGLSYGSSSIDMSDGSPNLTIDPVLGNFSFAVKTGLGRYVKLRIGKVITSEAGKDLVLEVFVYK